MEYLGGMKFHQITCYSTTHEFSELFKMAHSFTNVWKVRMHGQVLDFILIAAEELNYY